LFRKDGFEEGRLGKENKEEGDVRRSLKSIEPRRQGGAGGKGGGRGLPAEGVQALDRVGHLLPLDAFN
jgi:hypothetical protein